MKNYFKTIGTHFKVVTLFLLVFFLSIGYVSKKIVYENITVNEQNIIAGKQLFETRCNICHGIKDNSQNMLAPPFYNIKSKYSKVFRTKESFENAIIKFVSEPQKENTLMFGAVKQFGVMPKLSYPKDEIILVADYIYNTEFQKPVWCNGSKSQQHN